MLWAREWIFFLRMEGGGGIFSLILFFLWLSIFSTTPGSDLGRSETESLDLKTTEDIRYIKQFLFILVSKYCPLDLPTFFSGFLFQLLLLNKWCSAMPTPFILTLPFSLFHSNKKSFLKYHWHGVECQMSQSNLVLELRRLILTESLNVNECKENVQIINR